MFCLYERRVDETRVDMDECDVRVFLGVVLGIEMIEYVDSITFEWANLHGVMAVWMQETYLEHQIGIRGRCYSRSRETVTLLQAQIIQVHRSTFSCCENGHNLRVFACLFRLPHKGEQVVHELPTCVVVQAQSLIHALLCQVESAEVADGEY